MADEVRTKVAQEAGAWEQVEENLDDPEEVRVIFCALDSFSYVRSEYSVARPDTHFASSTPSLH